MFLGFPPSKTFDQTTMEEIIQSYHYKMDKLSKIQKGGTSDTYNGRKQEEEGKQRERERE